VTERASRIEELTLSLQNAPVVREQHQKVSNKLREVATRIADVQQRVPPDANAGEFLKQVTQLASAENVAIKDFSPGQPQSKGSYAEMEVTLSGSGSFASICSFVDRLARLKRLSKVKNLTLSASDDPNNYPMTATLVIYFGLKGKDVQATEEGRRG
jgi:Tfp pilus assembly protein PilO